MLQVTIRSVHRYVKLAVVNFELHKLHVYYDHNIRHKGRHTCLWVEFFICLLLNNNNIIVRTASERLRARERSTHVPHVTWIARWIWFFTRLWEIYFYAIWSDAKHFWKIFTCFSTAQVAYIFYFIFQNRISSPRILRKNVLSFKRITLYTNTILLRVRVRRRVSVSYTGTVRLFDARRSFTRRQRLGSE